MIQVVPAILVQTLAEIETALAKFNGVTSSVQIDVVDGVFAPNKTWPFAQGGQEELDKMLHNGRGSPLWKDFDVEIDLMVQDVVKEAERWVQAGASRIVVHIKSSGAREALLSYQHMRGEGGGRVLLGIALQAHDSPDALLPFEGIYDFVQVMGIDHEGFQGEPPDPHHKATELIKKIHADFPSLPLSVDGGIRMENILKFVEAGANRLVVGSLILSREDVKQALREIIEEANRR